MKIKQQIFTSGETEFISVAITEGIERNERIKLENNSLYMLPASLLYQENIVTPTKYVVYPLDAKHMVIGRAVYIGLDPMKRPGNYLFHNLIISKEDMMRLKINPAALIRQMESDKMFVDSIPDGALQEIEFPDAKLIAPKSTDSAIPEASVYKLLEFYFSREETRQSLLIVGTPEQQLDFIEWFYLLLPWPLRDRFSFDTYAYGTQLDFRIIGIPQEKVYQQRFPASMRFDLNDQTFSSEPELQAKPVIAVEYITFVSKMAAADQVDTLNLFYSLEDALETENEIVFKKDFKSLPSECQRFLYALHRVRILNTILKNKDFQLLSMLCELVSIDDLGFVFQHSEMIKRTLDHDDTLAQAMVLEWIYHKRPGTQYYHYIVNYESLFHIFLEKIMGYAQGKDFFLEVLQAIPKTDIKKHENELLSLVIAFSSVEGLSMILQDDSIIRAVMASEDSKLYPLLLEWLYHKRPGSQYYHDMINSAGFFRAFIEKVKTFPNGKAFFLEVLQAMPREQIKQFEKELLTLVKVYSSNEGLHIILQDNDAINSVMEMKEPELFSLMIDWLLLNKNWQLFYRFCFESDLFFQVTVNSKEAGFITFELFRLFSEQYEPEKEKKILEAVCINHAALRNHKSVQQLLSSITVLPQNVSEEVSLLRILVQYLFTKDPLLFGKLFTMDSAVLTHKLYVIFLDTMFEAVLNDKKSDISLQLNRLLSKSNDKRTFLLRLIAQIEAAELSHKAIKILKESFYSLLQSVPLQERKELIDKSQHTFKQKESFLRRFIGKTFRRS